MLAAFKIIQNMLESDFPFYVKSKKFQSLQSQIEKNSNLGENLSEILIKKN